MYIAITTDMYLLLLIHTTVLLRVTGQHNLTPFGTATQSSHLAFRGKPQYAIHPPISNEFSLNICSHTFPMNSSAWWMFQFSFGLGFIADITIYYRKNFEYRMDGFAVYVTNTTTIPPDGYFCYADPDPGLPNITQTIPCNDLGKYVIYYDNKGSRDGSSDSGPIVELCYIAINGCQKSHWGSNCEELCSENCIEQHCYPRNGSCVWGCNTDNCLNDMCDTSSGVCNDGCKETRTGNYCNKYNMASNGLVLQTPNGSKPGSLVTDGNKTSCTKTEGTIVTLQVDLQTKRILTGVYITFGEITNATKDSSHTVYASNTSTFLENGTVLYNGESFPTEIIFNAVFRFLTYVLEVKDIPCELEVCEIGIVGCPPSHYGPICNQSCPVNCHGPCDLETGNCIFGCLDGWIGDKCGQACQAGTYGEDCLATCSVNCLNQTCNTITGTCIGVCKDGWQGSNCTQECPVGQFGRNCSQFCNGCLLNMCDHVNGICDISTGCNPGYVYGNSCNTKCPYGRFGRNCTQFCKGCISNMCDPVNGVCDNRTDINPCYKYGNTSDPVSVNQPDADYQLSIMIGLFTGGFLFGVLMTGGVCILIINKRQLRNGPDKTQSFEVHHYDDVRMENVSTYHDLTRHSISNDYDQIYTAHVDQ